jgi:hypothetical protein
MIANRAAYSEAHHAAPVARREADDVVAIGLDRHIETSAVDPAEPPLEPPGMKDRTGLPARPRARDECEDHREIALAVERTDIHEMRL